MSEFGLNRRQVLAGMAGIGGSTLLYGCASKGTKTGTVAAAGGSPQSGVLNVWGGVPAEYGPGKLVEAFQKAYPKIKVTYTRFVNDPQGNLKLDTTMLGGSPIDVYFTYDNTMLEKRIKAGMALDVTSLAKKDPGLRQFAETNPQKTQLFGGKLHQIPTAASPYFVFINQDIADRAGVTIPENWDVDEFHEVAKKLSSKGVYGSFDAPAVAGSVLGGNANYRDGGRTSNFDDPAFRREIQLYLDMIKDGSAVPETEILARKLDAYQQNLFMKGEFAMWLTSSYNLRYVSDTKNFPHKFKTTFAPYPAPVKGQSFWNQGVVGSNLVISPKSEYQEAAWTFVKYWVTDGAKYMLPAGSVSPMYKGSDEEIVANLLGPDRDKLYDVDAFAKVYLDKDIKYTLQTITTAGPEIATIRSSLKQQVLLGQITVDDWAKQLKSQADGAIRNAG